MAGNTDLEDINGVGPKTAQKLRDAGYQRLTDLATASEGELQTKADLSENQSKKIIRGAMSEADVGGFESSADLLDRRNEEVGKITLGVDTLDDILSGGVEERTITEFFGQHSMGKSQFVHQLAVNVQLPREHGGTEKRAIIIDTEQSYRPERVAQMVRGLDDDVLQTCVEKEDDITGDVNDPEVMDQLVRRFLDRIDVAQAGSSDHQILFASEAIDMANEYREDENSRDVGLLAIDSITGHFRAEYIGRGDLSERQQKLQKHMNDLQSFADNFSAAVVLANQVLANPDNFFGSGGKASGGNVLKHRSTFRIELKNGKGDKYVFSLVDSPNMPDQEAAYKIEESGITGS